MMTPPALERKRSASPLPPARRRLLVGVGRRQIEPEVGPARVAQERVAADELAVRPAGDPALDPGAAVDAPRRPVSRHRALGAAQAAGSRARAARRAAPPRAAP